MNTDKKEVRGKAAKRGRKKEWQRMNTDEHGKAERRGRKEWQRMNTDEHG